MRRRLVIGLVLLVLGGGFLADRYVTANRFAPQLSSALEHALHRRVGVGKISFTWLHGPGLAANEVVIHEDPSFGAEPIAYVTSLEIRPRLLGLLHGRFEISSLRLDEPSVNLARNGDGPWNLQLFLAQTPAGASGPAAALPEIQVRGGRLNFRLSNVKSVFYITAADVDVVPSDGKQGGFNVRFSGEPARTDRPAQGLGRLTARGTWEPGPGNEQRVSISTELEKSPIADLTVLTIGRDLGIHGLVSARARLTGTPSQLDVSGQLELGDVHRWDLMAERTAAWPLEFKGSLDPVAQVIQLRTVPGKQGPSPVDLRFRLAGWLSQPSWGLVATATDLPLASLAATLRHLGASLPAEFKEQGTVRAVAGYSSRHGLHGMAAMRDVTLTATDLPPLEAESYGLTVDGSSLRLKPATIRFGESRAVMVEGGFQLDSRAHDLRFVTPLMGIPETARLQQLLGITGLPLLGQCRRGTWRGTLIHHADIEGTGEWNGSVEIQDAEIALPQFSEPLQIASAGLRLNPARTGLERIRGTLSGVAWRGDYRYEQAQAPPHRFRLSVPAVSWEQVQRALGPALPRAQGLIARTLGIGKPQLPDWLSSMRAEGSIAVEKLALGKHEVEAFRAGVAWEAAQIELRDIQMRIGSAEVKAAGRIDLERPLAIAGSFHTIAPHLFEDFEVSDLRGGFILSTQRGQPALRFPSLELVSGGETYKGTGSLQADGSVVSQLAAGDRILRITGSSDPFELSLEEAKPKD